MSQATPSASPSDERADGLSTQTVALLIDAYRDLQSRKLFWLTLILSGLVAGLFGSVGLNEQGFTIFGRLVPSAYNSLLIPPGEFFKLIFTTMAIPFWLGFLSSVLGLIAVGGIFPDAISSGSIDLYLCRPIGRLRLFLTKYIFGLLFTALQVLVFSTVSFLVIGLRGGVWELGIFLAVPLVTLFFSYLYSVCVLTGILTRSTLAAVLITGLFWGFLFVIHGIDVLLTAGTAQAMIQVDRQKSLISANEAFIARNAALPAEQQSNMSAFEYQRDAQRQQLVPREQMAERLQWWKDLVIGVKTPFPKTNETVMLMTRWLVRPGILDTVNQREAEMNDERRRAYEARRRGETPTARPGPTSASTFRFFTSATAPTSAPTAAALPTAPITQLDRRPEDNVDNAINADFGARDAAWIIGTSVTFELVMLSLSAWIFCRRDF